MTISRYDPRTRKNPNTPSRARSSADRNAQPPPLPSASRWGGDSLLAQLAQQSQAAQRSNAASSARLQGAAERYLQQNRPGSTLETRNNPRESGPSLSRTFTNPSPNPSPGGSSAGISSGGGGSATGGSLATPQKTSPVGGTSAPLMNLGPTDADRQRAEDLVELEYGPEIAALKRALEMIGQETQYQTDVQERYGNIGDQKLAAIYDALNKELNQNSQRIAGIYDTAQQDIGGYYDTAEQVAQTAGSGLANAIARRAETLGLDDSQADDDVLARLQGQLGNIQSQQAASEAETLSNLESLGGNLEATAVKAISDAAREGAQSRTGLVNSVQAAIADAGRLGASERYDVLGQLSEIAGNQGAAHRTTLQDLVEGRIDRERQSRLDMLAEELQRGALDIQRGQLGLSEQEFDFNKQITLQQLDMQRQQFEAEIAAASDPFERARAEADLQKTLAEIDKIYADINGTGAETPDYSGIQGIRQYLQDQNIPMRYSDQFNDFMGYARGGIPLDQLGSYAEELTGRVGGTVPFEQGMSALINRIAQPQNRPIYNDLLEIYLGKYQ